MNGARIWLVAGPNFRGVQIANLILAQTNWPWTQPDTLCPTVQPILLIRRERN